MRARTTGAGLFLLVTIVAAVIPYAAAAQSISIDLGEDATLTGRIVQLFLLITLLSLAPGIAIMVTCFPFMVTVLSLLRQGIGLQAAPPNMLIISLALFLTYFVMEPVFTEGLVDRPAPDDGWRHHSGTRVRTRHGAVPGVHGGTSPARDDHCARGCRAWQKR